MDIEFQQLQAFAKELKRFCKKYRSLRDDLAKLEAVLRKLPKGNGSKHWNKLHVSDKGDVMIYKVRLSCGSLKGKSLFRIIYAYNSKENQIVMIDFIELYFKGEKANNDQSLVDEYLKNEFK
jgi:mRNA-degrading endonuclease RelE of RelBE toxin-antitoxin system